MLNVPFVNPTDANAGLQLNKDITVENVTASAGPASADQIWVWVPSANAYDQFFYYPGYGIEYSAGWCDMNDAFQDYIENRPGYENGLPLGTAIYYKAKNGEGKVITGSGAIESKDEVELTLAGNNFTMIGNPYPTSLQLNGDKFVAQNATGNVNLFEADQIWVWDPSANAYDQFFYYPGYGTEYSAGWCDMNDAFQDYIENRPGYENGIASGTAMYYKAKTGDNKSVVFTSPLATK